MTVYFSLISPAPGQEYAAAQERLDGPYADHQWLWRWFHADPDARRDFLFRRHESSGTLRFYLLSARAPNERLGAWVAQSRQYAPELAVGDRLTFELRANPTVRREADGKSKRHDVVMDAKKALLAERGLARWEQWQGDDKPNLQELVHGACSRWWVRRGERLGFAADTASLRVEAYDQHMEQPDRNLRFSTVDLAGELTVTDPAAFRSALLDGVGSAKAFGCGLLLIRRA